MVHSVHDHRPGHDWNIFEHLFLDFSQSGHVSKIAWNDDAFQHMFNNHFQPFTSITSVLACHVIGSLQVRYFTTNQVCKHSNWFMRHVMKSENLLISKIIKNCQQTCPPQKKPFLLVRNTVRNNHNGLVTIWSNIWVQTGFMQQFKGHR